MSDKLEITVLLIEDNPGDARLLMEMLKLSNDIQLKVDWVQSLKEGFEWLKNNNVDVVCSDLSLPDSYGLDTLRSLLNLQARIPVIVMSGFDDEERANQAVEEGAFGYFVKGDLDIDILVQTIVNAHKKYDE